MDNQDLIEKLRYVPEYTLDDINAVVDAGQKFTVNINGRKSKKSKKPFILLSTKTRDALIKALSNAPRR